MKTADQILSIAETNATILEEVTENFISDVIHQLDILDPRTDGEDLLRIMQDTHASTKPGTRDLFEFILGMPFEEWLEESANK